MHKKKVIKNIISALVYQIIVLIYGFIIPRLIIGHFGSKVNGLTSSIGQFLSYISLLEFGVGPVIKNALFKPIVEKNKCEIENILGTADRFFKRIAYIFVVYILLLCLFYPLIINNEFSIFYTISLIIIISISQLFEYFLGMTYRMFLRADQHDYVIDYLNSLSYIINLILIIVLINLNCSIQIVKLASAVIFVLKPIFLKIYFDKKYGYKILRKTEYKLEKQWDGFVHHIASVVQNNTNILILTVFNNLINVSIYSVYALITNGLRQIIQAFTNGIDAFFGKLMVNGNQKDVQNKFELYCIIYHTISTIILSCGLVLIIPFIYIYTKNITDANYVNPIFGYVMIFTEFNYIIRLPYSSLTYAKGHFKETKNFSIIEPIVDLSLSIILVLKYGLVGVAFGSLIALLIRSFGFILHVARKILKTKICDTLKIIVVSYLEIVLIFIMHLLVGNYFVNSYFNWIIYAIITFITISLFICIINLILFNKELKQLTNRKKLK